MSSPRLRLTGEQILSFRRAAGSLDKRLPAGRRSLRLAAWAGLQDSMPRAALFSIHARVAGAGAAVLSDPSLVQLWGPRYSVFVVARRDVPVFSLARLPEAGPLRERAETLASRLADLVGESQSMTYEEVGRALGVHPNSLRYAALTGTVLICWEGARASRIWTIPPSEIGAEKARHELARRYLHVYGPTTAESFSRWAGMRGGLGPAAFEALRTELVPVRSPIGNAFLLASDEDAARQPVRPPAPARLLPSGDSFLCLHGRDRELVVPDEKQRGELWTPRVWPGGLLVGGQVVGTWRRQGASISVDCWRRLSLTERDAVVAEAELASLPGLLEAATVSFSGAV